MKAFATILLTFLFLQLNGQATMNDLQAIQDNETLLLTWGKDHDWSQVEIWASDGQGSNKLLFTGAVKGGKGRYVVLKNELRRGQLIHEFVTVFVTRSRHGVIFRDSKTVQLYYSSLVKLRTAG